MVFVVVVSGPLGLGGAVGVSGGVGCVLFLVFPRRLVAFAPVMGVPVRGVVSGCDGVVG